MRDHLPVSCITFSSSVRNVSGVPVALVPLAVELKAATFWRRTAACWPSCKQTKGKCYVRSVLYYILYASIWGVD